MKETVLILLGIYTVVIIIAANSLHNKAYQIFLSQWKTYASTELEVGKWVKNESNYYYSKEEENPEVLFNFTETQPEPLHSEIPKGFLFPCQETHEKMRRNSFWRAR